MILDSATRSFVEAMESAGVPPIETLGVEQARAAFEAMQGSNGVESRPAMEEYEIDPPGVKLRVIRPNGASGALPVVVYLHGGGWILGSFASHERLVRELAQAAGAAVVFVEYSRSPEARFPVALEQTYGVLRAVAERGHEWGLDGGRIVVAGDSAGGNLAAAVALVARERGGPAIATQILFCPMLDGACDSGSYREFADGPVVTRAAMEWFWEAYAPDARERLLPAASPLRATVEELRGLPPAVIVTGEYDVVRDEGEAYARKLMDAGVAVTAVRFAGAVHDFMALNALGESAASRAAIEMAAWGVGTCRLESRDGSLKGRSTQRAVGGG